MSWFNRASLTRFFRRTPGTPAPARARLRLDSLEDRTVPTVIGDMFADPIVLTGTSVSAFASTAGATGEAGEPDHGDVFGPLNSVWFKWTAPASGDVVINTVGSNFDTVLAVYTGTDLGNLDPVAANDDGPGAGLQSEVTFHAVGGTTYYIAVDGFGAAAGDVILNLGVAPEAPANDNFASALVVGNGTYTGSNVSATGEAGEPNHAGAAGPLNSVWFKWQAPADGVVNFDTHGSDFDTVMGVYTGDTVVGLTKVAANDDAIVGGSFVKTSAVSFLAQQGVTYYIAVDGFFSLAGNFVFNVQSDAAPPPPPSPPEQVDQLIALTESLANANALQAKLQNAQDQLARGNETAAANNLQAFVNQVQALVRSGRLAAADGESLISAAEALIDELRA